MIELVLNTDDGGPAMSFSKAIAAKVSAYYTGWVDPEEFAECAEKGAISIQRHYSFPHIRWGLFAIGKGEKEFPLDKLTDLNYVHHMQVVLPYDAVSPEILSILSLIESRREEGREVDETEWGTLEGRGLFELDVVADVGEDPSTGETRYGCWAFPFPPRIISMIQEELGREGKQIEDNAFSTSPDAIKVALEVLFTVLMKSGSWTTLSQVEEFSIEAKKWKVPQEIKGEKVLTGIGVGVDVIGTVRNVGDSDPRLLAKIEPGDIVIGVKLHPSELHTYCRGAAGFVTDKGGVTSNVAIFAKEAQIPAVVGTMEATQILKDGQKVIVSGIQGVVYI